MGEEARSKFVRFKTSHICLSPEKWERKGITDKGELVRNDHRSCPRKNDYLTEALRKTKDTDVVLLDILTEKILTMNPTEIAVVDVTKAIEGLANERAEASKNAFSCSLIARTGTREPYCRLLGHIYIVAETPAKGIQRDTS